nr:hypothetical protein CFP56_55923 [Quercus suber]
MQAPDPLESLGPRQYAKKTWCRDQTRQQTIGTPSYKWHDLLVQTGRFESRRRIVPFLYEVHDAIESGGSAIQGEANGSTKQADVVETTSLTFTPLAKKEVSARDRLFIVGLRNFVCIGVHGFHDEYPAGIQTRRTGSVNQE